MLYLLFFINRSVATASCGAGYLYLYNTTKTIKVNIINEGYYNMLNAHKEELFHILNKEFLR